MRNVFSNLWWITSILIIWMTNSEQSLSQSITNVASKHLRHSIDRPITLDHRNRSLTTGSITEAELLEYRRIVVEKGNQDPNLRDQYHRMVRQNSCRPLSYNWTTVFHDLPILFLSTGLHKYRFGNFIGSFLTSAACANLSGFHMMILNHGDNGDLFFQSLPRVIVNPNPAQNYDEAKQRYNSICMNDTDFPWDERNWFSNPFPLIPFIRNTMQSAMTVHMKSYLNGIDTSLYLRADKAPYGEDTGEDSPNLLEKLSADKISSLPVYPDVLIHYRCSDNLFHPTMGLLPFHAIMRYIPPQSRYIFILTELNMNEDVHPVCSPILTALQKDIQRAHPQASVILRKGGSVLLAVAMMMYSPFVICSSSTFCFYSSISNSNGVVYLPEKLFYNTYFNFENIHVMNNSEGIRHWAKRDSHGREVIYSQSNITSDVAISILRDDSYSM